MIPDNNAADTAEFCLFVFLILLLEKVVHVIFFSLKAIMTKPVVTVTESRPGSPVFRVPALEALGGSWFTDISCGWRGVRAMIGLGEQMGVLPNIPINVEP